MPRCYICDYCDDVDVGISLSDYRERADKTNRVNFDKVVNEFVCRECRRVASTSNKELETHNAAGYSPASDIQSMIEELERRIPELFVGPVCPGDCSCDCIKVCKLLNPEKEANQQEVWDALLEKEGLGHDFH